MSDITVRPATEADMVRISAIYGHSVATETASFELEPPDRRELERRWRALTDAGYPYIVAVDEGDVVGYAYVGPYRPRPAYRNTVENTVYVAREAQRRGIGRLLLERLIEEAESVGFRQMIAVIGGSEHVASIELHRKLGFTLVGTLSAVGYKHATWLDTVLMQRALGPAASAPPERPVSSGQPATGRDVRARLRPAPAFGRGHAGRG